MKKFLPIEEDLKIFNLLNSKIETIKNETLQNIQESPEMKNKKIKYNKYVKYAIFISVTMFIMALISVFLIPGSELLSLLLSFSFGFLSIFAYFNMDDLFEQYFININLSKKFLDKEELIFISKFMNKESLSESLQQEGLKISLLRTNQVLNSEYFQKQYTVNIANKIMNELGLPQ